MFVYLTALQKRLSALPPTLRSMKTDYASLRSQVRNFSDFYGSAIKEAKKQVNIYYCTNDFVLNLDLEQSDIANVRLFI